LTGMKSVKPYEVDIYLMGEVANVYSLFYLDQMEQMDASSDRIVTEERTKSDWVLLAIPVMTLEELEVNIAVKSLFVLPNLCSCILQYELGRVMTSTRCACAGS
jgi:hypothetical protein